MCFGFSKFSCCVLASMAQAANSTGTQDQSLRQKRNKALIPGVILAVNSFLSVQDSVSLKAVCSEWNKIVPRKLVLYVEDWHGHGDYCDKDKVFISETVNLGKEGLESIHVKCKWRDQGWGNKKGQIIIKLFRPKTNDADDASKSNDTLSLVAQTGIFGIAEHHWMEREISLTSTNELENGIISKSQNGDIVQFWRYRIVSHSSIPTLFVLYIKCGLIFLLCDCYVIRHVGGGGGHELFIKNFRAVISFKKSIQ